MTVVDTLVLVGEGLEVEVWVRDGPNFVLVIDEVPLNVSDSF